MHFWDNSMLFQGIRFKLSVVILLLLLATTMAYSVMAVRIADNYIRREVTKRAETVGRAAAASAAYSLMANDMLGIDNVVSKTKESHLDVDYIAILNPKLKVLAHSDLKMRGTAFKAAWDKPVKLGREGALFEKSGEILELVTPVTFLKKHLGYVVIGLNKTIPMKAQKEIRTKMFQGFLIALIIGVLGIIIVSSIITKPVKELATGVTDLKENKRVRPLKVYGNDEFGELTRSFNEMSSLITEQKERLGAYAKELETSYISTLRVLAAAIDARDPYTLGHSTRVAALSVKMGQALGMSAKELEDLEIACLFHDLGKLKTPDYILLKEGPLDSLENREMMRHPEDGAEILARAPSLLKYIPAVKYHHEWYNGKGYPEGLKGDEIPLIASIISIADCFDAMTSTRPYRKPRSEAGALKELVRCSGTQFSPKLVQLFLKVFRDEHEGFLISEVI